MLAAILTAHNASLELREIKWFYHPNFVNLEYGQVLVKIHSSGICGAQLSEIRGDKNEGSPLPRLLGHEAVGEVIDIGYGVTKVSVGQKVVCHWRRGDGVESQNAMWYYASSIGIHHHSAGLIATFATHSVISENRLTPVPDDTPDDLAVLLGCGLSTALGTIENEANLKIGESVLIIGCGGLGLNLILAAKMRQAGEITVFETHISKMESAMQMGATYFWVPVNDNYPVSVLFDVVIDTTGNPDAMAAGLKLLAPSGRFIMVGQPKPGQCVQIPNARNLFSGDGCRIMATQGGRFNPTRDIPKYIAAWRAGRLNIDGIVTHRFPLSEINAALDCVRNGQAGRVLVDCAE